MRPNTRTLLWGIGVAPLVLAVFVVVALRQQPQNLWRRLMPSQIFSHPQNGLQALILTRTDKRNWETLFQSTYFYKGGWSWLIPKEALQAERRPGPGAKGLPIAVDANGRLFRFENAPEVRPGVPGGVLFTPLEKLPEELQKRIESGVILAEDPEVFKLLQARVQGLKARSEFLVMETALARQDMDASAKYGTQLSWSAIPRVYAWLVFCCALPVLAFLVFAASPYRSVWAALALPVGTVLVLWAVNFTSLISGWLFGVLPYLLAIVAAGLTVRYAQHSRVRLAFPPNTRSRLLKQLPVWLSVVICTVYFSLRLFHPDLTWGDACAFTFSGAALYDSGVWDLKHFQTYPLLKNFLTYPAATAVLMAYGLWTVGPDKSQIFFPGAQTGSALALYALLLIALHLSTLLALWQYLRIRVPQKPVLALVGVLVTLAFWPSALGRLHGAEVLLWPVFVAALVSVLTLRFEDRLRFWVPAVVLCLGLLYIKKEATLQIPLLLLPWLLPSALKLARNFREKQKDCLLLAATVVFFLLPFFALIAQRFQLQITGTDFHPVVLSQLFSRPTELLAVWTQAFAIFLGKADVTWVDFPIPLVLCAICLVIYRQCRRPNLAALGAFAGVAFLVAVVPLMYHFSTWNPPWLHIFQSWGRILVPAYLALVFLSVENLIEST